MKLFINYNILLIFMYTFIRCIGNDAKVDGIVYCHKLSHIKRSLNIPVQQAEIQ